MINFISNPLVPKAFDPGAQEDKTQPRHVSYSSDGIHEVRNRDRCGLPVFLDPPRTRHDAEGLRLLFRRIARTCMKTTSSARTNILQLPHYCENGRPAFVISGVVSDAHFDTDGNLDRICLLDPCALDPDTGEASNIDTHIWLFTERITIPDLSLIRSHAGLADDLLTISLGDCIVSRCYLNAYMKGARKRIGIDEWLPFDSQLYYADRNGVKRRIPNHIKDGLEMLSVRADGTIATPSEQDWATRLLAALGHHIDEASGRIYEYSAVKTLLPLMGTHQFAA